MKPKLFLFKIEHKKSMNRYDYYDSAIVVAESEEEAKTFHPSHIPMKEITVKKSADDFQRFWTTPENIIVTKLGTSDFKFKCVVLSSFNAG